ncbi:hypothetical protein CYMTET_44549 [Cymbomonas tetramitiformis]|uniref:SET domain-containing protein n=1 Tax=Cymbomonas tetramitiformis TaxID=36881 RepID=A0AAE0EZH4_9CHLO|nr:hypothetical protein CYMTET_44549 [Cymbomonas tetramitiformis]|eukprot:gene25413-31032_t
MSSDNVEADKSAKLLPFWEGAPSELDLSSAESVRRLLSSVRVAVAVAEDQARLDSTIPTVDAARFPISALCERAAMQLLREHLAPIMLGDSTATVKPSERFGWAKVDILAETILQALEDPQLAYNVPKLATAVHHATRRTLGAREVPTQECFAHDVIETRDSGGIKGRGYFATGSISAGTVLLVEIPHVLDASEADFPAAVAVHALGLEGAVEYRPMPEDTQVTPGSADAVRWLRAMEGFTEERVVNGFKAAINNGFQSTLPDVHEKDPMLLFERLSIFNHSCTPNCVLYRDEMTGTATILSTQEVVAGSELTIHYADELLLLPTGLRRPFLQGRFGFECLCARCEGTDEAACAVDALLEAPAGDAENPAALHEMRRAHATLCVMSKRGDAPCGFSYRKFDDWQQALAAVDAALPSLTTYGAPTFWARHHARELRCLALEALGREAAAFQALAEHAATAWRLLPQYCQGLLELHRRLDAVRSSMPAALQSKMEERVRGMFGEGLEGLERDVETLKSWRAAVYVED